MCEQIKKIHLMTQTSAEIFLKLLLKNFAGLFGKHGLSRSQAGRKMIFQRA